ncbi:MAG: phosphatidylserine decarboxylase [Gammaproteobacteria bacterium]|nr:phosphatidylserine decarboxylase [Gammaproteobacteria bacterium]
MFDKLFAAIQYPLPHHFISGLVFRLMRIRFRPIKNLLITVVGGLAGADWSEADRQELSEYEHFNDFFTRELHQGARVIDPDPGSFVSPADGRISQCGRITSGRILQAKGHHYSVRALLAEDPASDAFINGYFHTVYLSPRDYHRVHMPADGELQRMIHVPGRAFSVSPGTVRAVPNLFARNERVVSLFENEHGPMAVILVGAMLVSSVDTVWSGTVTPPRARRVQVGDWSRRDVRLEKGQEMGRFNMGSTVIVLWPPTAIATLEHLEPNEPVLMGQRLGTLR